MSKQTSLEEKISKLKSAYIEKLKGIIINLESSWEDIENNNIENLYNQVHKISGTSGMYGLSELSEISTLFEIYLKSIIKSQKEFNKNEVKSKLSSYINDIKNRLD